MLLPGLGENATHVLVTPEAVLAIGPDNVLRAVVPARPEAPLWSVSLGGAPASAPVLAGDAVFILVDGRVIAVER
jgi:hypothetical protein